jgi:phosphatidylserine/phosphatidylglycerophosphate/cardiolipin synthase-like enzyme
MKVRVIVFLIFLGLLASLTVLMMAGQLCVAHRWLHDDTCEEVGLHGDLFRSGNVDVRILPSIQMAAQTLFELVSEAETSFCATFYMFQYDAARGHVISQAIGDGLLRRQGKPLTMKFVLNCPSPLALDIFKPMVGENMGRWQAMGIPVTTLMSIEWYIYRHRWFDNMHSKIITVDEGANTIVWTGNIESKTPGDTEDERWEMGLLFRDRQFGARAHREIESYLTKSTRTRFRPKPQLPPPRIDSKWDTRSDWIDVGSVCAVFLPVRQGLFWKLERDTLMAQHVGTIIQGAQYSIDICSPQVNDPFWWRCAIDSRAPLLRFLTERNMDNRAGWFQKYFAGNRTNQQFYDDYVRPGTKRVLFHTLDDPGIHTKLFVIDKEIVVFGSMNFTVFSTRTSSEVAVVIRNKIFAKHCLDLFESFWQRSHAYDDPLCTKL